MTPEKAREVLEEDVQLGVIPEALAIKLLEQMSRPLPNPYQSMFGPVPPRTIRQRLRSKWWRVKSYLRHVGLALLDRCDREGYDW